MKKLSIICAICWLRTLALAGTCPSNVPPGVSTCFYADFVAGSDSNDGAGEASGHPWQHIPGMTGCTNNCKSNTPSGGTGYILKGGSVWTNATLPWLFAYSGTSSNPIYVGYDPAWNTGKILSIRPATSGYNCSAISVTLSGGGGSGAAGTANFQTSNYLAGLLQHVTITNAGSSYSSNPTVSFSGSTCTQPPTATADIYSPIIDASGTIWNESNGASPGVGPIDFYGNYVTVDHIEFRGMAVNATIAAGAGTLYLLTEGNGTGVTFQNLYLHNFGPNTIATSGSPSFSGTGGFSINQGQSGTVTVTNSYLDNYEGEVFVPCGFTNGTASNFTPPCGSSSGIVGATTLTNNVIHDSRGQVYSPAGTGLNYSNNYIWDTVYDCCGDHVDTFYFFGSGVIYNNILHDAAPLSAANFYIETCRPNPCTTGNTTYLFNNVVWNVGTSTPPIGFSSEFWTTNAVSPSPTLYAYNNTFYAMSGTSSCINAGQFYGSSPTSTINFTLYNNHCISTQTSQTAFGINDPTDCTTTSQCGTWNGLSNPNGSSTQTALNSLNTVMSPSTASTQGYTIANLFAPAAASGATVTAAGTNYSPCTGTLSPLCTGLNTIARPPNGSWNTGAYQYLSASVTPPPSAVTALVH